MTDTLTLRPPPQILLDSYVVVNKNLYIMVRGALRGTEPLVGFDSSKCAK